MALPYYTRDETDDLLAAKANRRALLPWAQLVSLPTTASGYGIGDVYTKGEVDDLLAAEHTHDALYAPIDIETEVIAVRDGEESLLDKINVIEGVNSTQDGAIADLISDLGSHTHTAFAASDAATNSVSTALILGHATSGTPAVGLGTSLVWQIEASDGNQTDSGRITSVWEDPTAGFALRSQMAAYVWGGSAYTKIWEGSYDIVGPGPAIGFLGASPLPVQQIAGFSSPGDTAELAVAVDSIVNLLVNFGLATDARG